MQALSKRWVSSSARLLLRSIVLRRSCIQFLVCVDLQVTVVQQVLLASCAKRIHTAVVWGVAATLVVTAVLQLLALRLAIVTPAMCGQTVAA